MGKKKTIRSGGEKLTSDKEEKSSISTKKSVQNKRPTKKKESGAVAKKSGPISQDKIGLIAGKVWKVLSEEGEQTPSTLKKKIKAPTDLVQFAIGWLAREGKLQFTAKGRSVQISLR